MKSIQSDIFYVCVDTCIMLCLCVCTYIYERLSMVAHSFNPSIQDVETGEPGLQRASQGYKGRPYLKRRKKIISLPNVLQMLLHVYSQFLYLPLCGPVMKFALWQGMWPTH